MPSFTHIDIRNLLRRLSRPAPIRDWLFLLSVAAIVLVGIVAWNVWNLRTLLDRIESNASSAQAPLLDRASLDNAHTLFENRATEESMYVNGEYQYSDPSQ